MTETKYPEGTRPTIEDIAKNDAEAGLRAFGYGADHPAVALWVDPQTGLLPRLAREIERRGVHAARALVLLPYAQLLPLANRLWARLHPDGFAPRFETTMNWCAALGRFERGALDITFDAGLDQLTAQALLVQAGLGAQKDPLASLLVQAAWQLAPLAAASSPNLRDQWAQRARLAATLGMDAQALQWESAVARIAVEWVAVSGYASDILYDDLARDAVDLLVMVHGFSPDPLTKGLAVAWEDKLLTIGFLPSAEEASQNLQHVSATVPALHSCLDAEDEAQRSAACALRHVQQDRFPVALVSSDRSLTRRIRALLESAGIAMRDENGWKLSTSRAAAHVMALLHASAWHVSTDAVIDWLKCAPAFQMAVDPLEATLRRNAVRDWSQVSLVPAIANDEAMSVSSAAVEAVRSRLQGAKTLPVWLQALRAGLNESGLWELLTTDEAGGAVLDCLYLSTERAQALEQLAATALWAQRRMDLSEFTRWVNHALEGASFQPTYPAEEQVVILPMSQMLGRPFAALVLAGCDEVRLNTGVEPPGVWTAKQRDALGLPSRGTLDYILRASWELALQTPACDVLWRTSDETGESLLSSMLVQLLQSVSPAADPREERTFAPAPMAKPAPVGKELSVATLSASAYDDLRTCPYRFFALRQLGLKPADELESELDKRDFGLWLHAVLNQFHLALQQQPLTDLAWRIELMDRSAALTTESMALPEGEFLPYMAAWPAVRDRYLHWLAGHEAQGAQFLSAETAHRQALGPVTLVGRIDRIDVAADGSAIVLDYKTEPGSKTRERVKDPAEDTQIAFYAALLPDDILRGGYVNVGERDGTVFTEQKQLAEARDALLDGIQDDMLRISEGATLAALGEGTACDFCQARGLCRKDFWS